MELTKQAGAKRIAIATQQEQEKVIKAQ
jgi:hypothetical protein